MAQPWDEAQFDRVYYDTPESYMYTTPRGPGWPGGPSGRQGVICHYCRWLEKVREPWAEQMADAYVAAGVLASQTCVVVGSGYGWSIEVLIDKHGFDPARIVGIDTSPHIQTNKAGSEEADIDAWITEAGAPAWFDDPSPLDPTTGRGAEIKAWLLTQYGGSFDTRTRADIRIIDETLKNPGSRRRARRAVDAALEVLDWAVFEFGLSSYTDAELALILPDIDATPNGSGGIVYLVATTNSIPDANPEGFNRKTLAEWRTFIDLLDSGAYAGHILIDGKTFEQA